MISHLTRFGRIAEMLMAAFGVYIGLALVLTSEGGLDPLGWIDIRNGVQEAIGMAFIIAGIIHATGVRINGRWAWSPLLRVIGMTVHASLVIMILLATADQNHAGPLFVVITEFPVAVVFWLLALGSYRDLKLALLSRKILWRAF